MAEHTLYEQGDWLPQPRFVHVHPSVFAGAVTTGFGAGVGVGAEVVTLVVVVVVVVEISVVTTGDVVCCCGSIPDHCANVRYPRDPIDTTAIAIKVTLRTRLF